VTTTVVQRLLGGRIEPSVRPLVVSVLLGSLARSVLISFTGIWAMTWLLATDRQLGVAYAVAGVTAAFTGYGAGTLADRWGARRVLLAGWLAQTLCLAGFALTGHEVAVGLTLIVLTTSLATFSATASQTVVTEVLPAAGRTSGFAALRLGQNLGYATGPPAAALVLPLGWPVVFTLVAVVAAVTAGTVFFRVPPGSPVAAEKAGRASIRTVLADRGFARMYVAGCLSMIVYSAGIVLLPVSLTEQHGVSPRLWGLLAMINPVLVIALQLRVVARLAPVPLSTQAATAVLLMGLPFLWLPLSVAAIAAALALFTVGEVIWAPAAQTMVTAQGPDGRQGAYLGAFAATLPIGLAAGPMIGFQTRAAWGDTAMWLVIAGLAVAAAALYARRP
jgi:predicted MFS family arabinose efflux permease